jgi:periplasmic protein TonB
MSATTVNSFPPIHAFDSPRSWFLAFIIILHIGFFWALSNGLSFSKLILPPPSFVVDFVEDTTRPPPTPPDPVVEPKATSLSYVPPQPVPNPDYETDKSISGTDTPQKNPPIITRTAPQPELVVVEPAIPRTGLSEPLYPPSAIRAEHEGTVLLSLEVLENGRVGEIRLLQSSGYAKLDESALREARKWRFVPGTRDGRPVTLWKQVPITFELQDGSK